MINIGLDVGGTKLRGSQVIISYESEGRLVDAKLGENLFDEPELAIRKYKDPKKLNEMVYKSVRKFGSPDEVVVSGSIAGIINKETLDAICANIPFPLTFLRYLRDKKGYKRVFAYNDLFAAGTTLTRLGPGKKYSKVAVQNIGSGNNIAVAKDGIVITEGTEAGHQFYIDGGIFCGCGGYGHLESYASGNGAAVSALTYFKTNPKIRRHPILEEALRDWNLENEQSFGIEKLKDDAFWREILFAIQGKHIMTAYAIDPEQAPQKEIRRVQRNAIAYQLGQITDLYRPELIIIRGSFVTENWDNLGKPAVQRFLNNYNRFVHLAVERPKIEKKRVKRDGVIGAALCANDDLNNSNPKI